MELDKNPDLLHLSITLFTNYAQRQSFADEGVLKNVAKFHRETLVLESLFNKVAGL